MPKPPVLVYLNLRRTALEHGPAIDAARREGYGVALLTEGKAPAGLDESIVLSAHEGLDLRNLAEVDRAVDAVAADFSVRGVVTWSDPPVETVAHIAQRLGLPGPSPVAASRARNKWLMRQTLADAGEHATIPAFARVTTWAEAEKAAKSVGFPAVLKPTSASGSKGIWLLDSVDRLRESFDDLMRYTTPEADPVFRGNVNELIFEQRLVGTEHSVEGFVHRGNVYIAGVTDKVTTEPWRLEVGHTFPSELPAHLLGKVHELTATVVRTLGLDNCPIHLECMVDAETGTAKLVEVAARPGGDFITSHLVTLATGTSFHRNVVRVATGLAPLPADAQPLTAGVHKVMAEQAGVLESVDGFDVAAGRPGVQHVVQEAKTGASVTVPPVGYNPVVGAVIATGGSPDVVRARLHGAAGSVHARIRAAGGNGGPAR